MPQPHGAGGRRASLGAHFPRVRAAGLQTTGRSPALLTAASASWVPVPLCGPRFASVLLWALVSDRRWVSLRPHALSREPGAITVKPWFGCTWDLGDKSVSSEHICAFLWFSGCLGNLIIRYGPFRRVTTWRTPGSLSFSLMSLNVFSA